MNNNNNNINNSSSNKGKLGFIILLFIVLLIIVIIIIKATLNKNKLENQLVINTFFTEMKYKAMPYNAWCKLKDVSNASINIKKHCSPICIRGKRYTNGIPSNLMHITNRHSLMFWFKIKKEYFEPKKYDLSYSYPLIYFSKKNIIPSLKKAFGFYIVPINNTLKLINENGKELSNIYNLPYDKWICVTSVINNNVIDIYINGRLLKTAINNNYNMNNHLYPLKWGPYPGDLAFVEVNNNNDDLNPERIYDNFKYYYNIINDYDNYANNKILKDIPSFKSSFRRLTQWDKIMGYDDTANNKVCY